MIKFVLQSGICPLVIKMCYPPEATYQDNFHTPSQYKKTLNIIS